MYETCVRQLQAGDVLAQPIIGPCGRLILGRGTALNPSFIRRLQERGVASVYIESDRGSGLGNRSLTAARQSAKPLEEKTQAQKERILRELMDRLGAGRFNAVSMRPSDGHRFHRVYRNALIDALAQPKVVQLLGDLHDYDDILYEHALNVSVLSGMLGMKCGYTPAQMLELAIGSLLFDAGMTAMPAAMLTSPQRLGETEREQLRSHTVAGFEMLMAIEGMPQLSANCALQHHERYDGSGYPLHAKKGQIHEYAQIIAICDMYDALTSPRRYRNAYPPEDVIEFMNASGNYYFDAGLVKLFLKQIAAYPLSSVVTLSNGQTGIVTAYSSSIAHRPVVKIIQEADGQRVPMPYELDLALASTSRLTVLSCFN